MDIKIYNRKVTVSTAQIDEFGYLLDGCKIVIRQGLDHGDRLDTLVHELLHAICDVVGLHPDNEEGMVHAMATGLTTVMIDNPVFMSAIRQLANDAREDLR